ncbi:hypothetical protein HDU86_005602 [Geranomyces michiganensis]|nr:hypothetical protein HDU86_005602 [Geranomyces michiganensis]
MLTGETCGPSVLTRILTALGYEPPSDASADLEQILTRAYASEDARPFLDWLCAAFTDALDVPPQVSVPLGTCWNVLSEEESEAWEELQALGLIAESGLTEYSDEAEDIAQSTDNEELEASIELLTEQLKRVTEHVKTLDLQHQCLFNSHAVAASKSTTLSKKEIVAEQTLVDLDDEVRALSLQIDAAVTEAATAAGKLADLAATEQTARSTHHYPLAPAEYLYQCAAEIAAWSDADDDLDSRLSACFDKIYPRDPRDPDMPILTDSLHADGPPQLDLPAELAAEFDRLTSLFSLTERDHHIASLRAFHIKEKVAALEEHLADRKTIPPTVKDSTPLDPADETIRALDTLQQLWDSAAARSISIPFLASIYTRARVDRESRLHAATTLTQDLRALLARATLLHDNLVAERRALREQGAAMQAVAEHVTTIDAGLTARIDALTLKKPSSRATNTATTKYTAKTSTRDASGHDALAGFLTRVIKVGSSSCRTPDASSQIPLERIAVRETLPRLMAHTETLRAVLCEHMLTAVPLLAPKELLDGEQAVREATADLGRALRDATAIVAQFAG